MFLLYVGTQSPEPLRPPKTSSQSAPDAFRTLRGPRPALREQQEEIAPNRSQDDLVTPTYRHSNVTAPRPGLIGARRLSSDPPVRAPCTGPVLHGQPTATRPRHKPLEISDQAFHRTERLPHCAGYSRLSPENSALAPSSQTHRRTHRQKL